MTKFDYQQRHWADPIERPAQKQAGVLTVYVTLLCIAAVVAVIWRAFA